MFWVRLALALVVAAMALWWFGPREPALLGPVAVTLPEDLEAWVAAPQEGVRPGLAPQLVWAGKAGEKTPIAVVYLHGFSASPLEIAPVPRQVAQSLGANLYLPLLTGHGRDGAALAQATVADWWRDTAQAIAVGQRLGERVVLIGTSNGGTLVAEAARDPGLGPKIAAVVMISPNFRIRQPLARLLRWPFARQFVPLIAGAERCFDTVNQRHAAAWTSCYPPVAALPVAALVAHAQGGDYAAADQPALLITALDDQVVDPAAAEKAMGTWGGDVTRVEITPAPGDDPSHHVIAGEILSPGSTQTVTDAITVWLATALE